MKKAISMIAVFVVFLLSVSAHTERVFKAENGYKAPDMTVANTYGTVSLSDMNGSYVLVTFWSADDAESRVAMGEYDALIKSGEGTRKLRLLAVNTDGNERLFREIVRLDGLDEKTQYRAYGTNADDIESTFGTDSGIHSLLVSPEGDVLATNPDISTVKRIVI
ncbi:MAG: peroxiredoxin family protein [Muribaculaceae bacterium]|nr:peroxiredoxin family protein [Muribaculaceae bacterium]